MLQVLMPPQIGLRVYVYVLDTHVNPDGGCCKYYKINILQ